MRKLRELPLQLFVRTQAAAVATGTSASEYARTVTPTNTTQRLQVALGAFVGFYLLNANLVMAQQGSGQASKGILRMIDQMTKFAIGLVAFGSVLMMLWSALLYITSGGNQTQVGKAKTAIKYVIVGLAVAAGIYVIKSIIFEVVGAMGVKTTDVTKKGI